jgi:hypothetical protein
VSIDIVIAPTVIAAVQGILSLYSKYCLPLKKDKSHAL